MSHHHSSEMDACIQACLDCSRECLSCATGHCLESGGKHTEPRHLRLMLDCADICQTSAAFMTRHSDLHQRTCELCAEVCAACAMSCSHIDDEHIRHCAETCRRCIDACQAMTASVA